MFFIHSPSVDKWAASPSCAVVNMDVQRSVQDPVLNSLDIEVKVLDPMVTLFLIFWGTPTLCSATSKGSNFATPSPTLHFCSFGIGPSSGWEAIARCGLFYVSLIISDVEHLFTCSLVVCIPLETCAFQFFDHFLNGLLIFLLLSYKIILYIMYINPY